MTHPRKRIRGISAWLVTWNHVGQHAAPAEKVVAILGARTSAASVLKQVEWLYANATFDLSEKIAYAKSSANFNPYPARFGELSGATWAGEIYCGHNPFLFARIVDDLRVKKSAGGEEAEWKERPKPKTKQAET